MGSACRTGRPDSKGGASDGSRLDRLDRFAREPLPREAAFLAGKSFVAYRSRGGRRGSPLPDFYIGAHAAVAGMRLLTRDASRYRTYYPTVELIAPE